MASDRDDLSECICHCGSTKCRGLYVKPRPKSPLPTPMAPIYAPSMAGEYELVKHQNYKISKFVSYMLHVCRSKEFATWSALSKDKKATQRYLSCFGHSNLTTYYLSQFISKNELRIKLILKSHGKKLKFTTLGFGISSI